MKIRNAFWGRLYTTYLLSVCHPGGRGGAVYTRGNSGRRHGNGEY